MTNIRLQSLPTDNDQYNFVVSENIDTLRAYAVPPTLDQPQILAHGEEK